MSVDITAPLSGAVWKIQVKVGDKVSEEDELMILEALKMEIPIYAPSDGTVAEIKVSADQEVEANQVLMVLE